MGIEFFHSTKSLPQQTDVQKKTYDWENPSQHEANGKGLSDEILQLERAASFAQLGRFCRTDLVEVPK